MSVRSDNWWLSQIALSTAASAGAAAPTTAMALGGVFNTTPPTYANGQLGQLQINSSGDLKTTLATLIAGEDLTNNVIKVEERFSYAAVSTATTTTIKSGAGHLHTLTIAGGTLGAITVYDNTTGSGTLIIPTFTPTATLPCPPIVLDVSFTTGLTIVTSAATIITVSYR